MSAIYLHQLKGWPNFQWNNDALAGILGDVRFRQGRLLGSMEGLGFNLQDEATLETLTLDVLKSSEIEGEILNHDQVRSSIARRLGIEVAGLIPADRNVEGIVEMMLDATQRYDRILTADRLFGWQASMFPTGFSGMYKIVVGCWRNNAKDDPMQVVSGGMGREKVHFQAPDSDKLDNEMSQFLHWFNAENTIDPIIKAAVAHLWFVTIHPFDDGNGRIARAITDMQLTRADETPRRFYSMSAQIRIERNGYYAILESTQKGTLDITEWIEWFINCLGRALNATELTLAGVIKKARFWNNSQTQDLNSRQKMMLNKLLDGFEGKFTSSKWGKIAKCSQDTAVRDIQDLIDRNILVKDGSGGRSTGYLLSEEILK
ncbi:Fic family protein [Chitinophaga sancti]|uniref:Fic family protein n=1 Tax=Chitinophaga sancti TaxID=1004 RepID=A0A1K1RPS5_9BACT|nr:Fic family protein [Chitinophaga sancti]WQD62540.1 Fic family protein [Chitinophaga sancti]WQG91891.1 Fic family protein [Chitinophaga sancti]SFW74046.1 Fic family protein [Chitinophaga sancti]